jgi:hypothetical protein
MPIDSPRGNIVLKAQECLRVAAVAAESVRAWVFSPETPCGAGAGESPSGTRGAVSSERPGNAPKHEGPRKYVPPGASKFLIMRW